MSRHYAIIIAAALFLSATSAVGQPFQTAYFLDNYVYSYQINPALAPDNVKGFFGIGVGNISAALYTDFAPSSVVFPVRDSRGEKSFVTGFDEQVSSTVFPGQLKDLNKVLAGVDLNVLSFGVGSKKSFYSFELNVKGNASATVPKSLLSYIKDGIDEQGSYSFSDASVRATEYIEVVNGYSYRINDFISLGGRLKILAGLSDADVSIDCLQADINKELKLKVNGGVSLFALNQQIPVTPEGKLDIDDFEVGGIRPGGFGAALDLGAVIRFPGVSGLSLSVAALDLGGIFWTKGTKAFADGSEQIFSLEDGKDVDVMSAFNVTDSDLSKYIGLNSRVNAGIRYRFSRMFSVGTIFTTGIGRYRMTEGRAGVTFTPGKVFSLAASCGFNPYGSSIGCAMSLKVPGFNLFLGTDSLVTSFTEDYIPSSDMRTRLNLGLAIAF